MPAWTPRRGRSSRCGRRRTDGRGRPEARGEAGRAEGRRIPAGSSVQTHALQKPRNFLGGECPLTRPHLLRGLTWALMARLATPRSRLESPLHCRPLGRLGQVLGSSRPQGAAQAASRHLREGRDPWGQGRKPDHPPPQPSRRGSPGPGQSCIFYKICNCAGRTFKGSLGVSGASQAAQLVRNPPAVRKTCVFPGLGRSPGERNGYPLQYSGLENSTDCKAHGVTNRGTRLSDFLTHR